jgi:HEPN domain-containing protein
MNETVSEWFRKAEADYATAGRELHVKEDPNYDAVCYHAEQCVEKLMKGLLIHLGVVPPKNHDVANLGRLLTPVCPEWSWPMEELRFLTRAAVDFRYPGEFADSEEASTAFDIATRPREKLLTLFPPEASRLNPPS